MQVRREADDACRHSLQDGPCDARRCVSLCVLLRWHVFERDEFFFATVATLPSSMHTRNVRPLTFPTHGDRHGPVLVVLPDNGKGRRESQCHCCCQHAHLGGGW